MKRLFTLLITVVLTVSMFAQAPQKMSYQAVIRDNLDHLVTNHAVGIQITILQDSPTGTVVYTETQKPSTNANGLISIEIGGGAGFSSINWASGTYFLKTETDPDGGINYTISGTSQLLSVPFALHAENAENFTETDPNAILLTGNQTVAGNKTFTGTITVPTPVNATDAVTKAYVDALLQTLKQLESQPGIVKDAEGNLYTTIKIGTQVWMAENLKATKYKDGTAIPLVTDNTAWSNLTAPGYCWYNNDAATYKSAYGALYNWYTVNTGNLCPAGWHAPTLTEMGNLQIYLIYNGYNYDGTTTSSNYAKSLASTILWASSTRTGAVGNTDYPSKRNATGFTFLPGGLRVYGGQFGAIGDGGDWWTVTEFDATSAIGNYLYFDISYLSIGSYNKKNGFSVRCVRD